MKYKDYMNLSVCTTWLTSAKQEITGIWIVGDETARCLQIKDGSQQLLLGLPLHKIPDAKAASVQNFGNVAFIVNDFDGPDFQLIQVGYSELSVMNAMQVLVCWASFFSGYDQSQRGQKCSWG